PEMAATHRRGSWLPWLLCLVFAGAAAALAYRQFYSTPVAGPEPPNSNSTATGDEPTAAEGPVALESKGYIIPAHQILVSPQVNGRIEKLFVEEGRRVKRGDVLAELERVEYQAQAARCEALLIAAQHKLLELERGNRPDEIEQAKAELAETEAQRDQLQAEWQRNQRLRATKTITDMDYEKSESAYHAMAHRAVRLKHALALMIEGPRTERIDLAKAEVKQAEAELTHARWRLDNCTIRAPVSGTILKKNAEEGNIVNPVAFNGSFSLCEMADLSDLEVDLAIQERDVSLVHKGQQCKVRSEAFPDRVYDGEVSRLMPIADRAKGAIPVRVKLRVPPEEEGVYLKPEMGAIVQFLREPASHRSTAP
ncbi:MAG TPA: efflux RND transporter periplasmic adaptor subunit, partial [Pirellulales bacterium]|nr:efflux RND transporter periplasmic adaptor subunit [Pirellulales bacterium]